MNRSPFAPPGFLLWPWPLLDRVVSKRLGIRPLRLDKPGILAIEMRHHPGQLVRLEDGATVAPGDLLIELHMNNRWFIDNRNDVTRSAGEGRWRVSSAFAEDLRYLARAVTEGKLPAEVTALHGVTLLYPPAQRLGFTVEELPAGLRKQVIT
jgi:hypothetical protein